MSRTIDCENCGETFDPYREPKIPGGDSRRCAGCGHKHDHLPENPPGATAETVSAGVGTEGDPLDIHIHVHRA